jgi:hypothetical protein
MEEEDCVTTGAGDSPFEPSLWEDFFVTYSPPISQENTYHCHEFIDIMLAVFQLHYLEVYIDSYTYMHACMQRSEEWKTERMDQLKTEMYCMFDTSSNAMSTANTLMLVDALERLGIDRHFQKEIDTALLRVHNEDLQFDNTSTELHIVALRFRLLRQHGFFVSTGS